MKVHSLSLCYNLETKLFPCASSAYFKEEAQAAAFLSQVPVTATGVGVQVLYDLSFAYITSVFPEKNYWELGGVPVSSSGISSHYFSH